MSATIEHIDGIEWKVQKLVQKMKLLKQENQQLLDDNVSLRNELQKIKDNKDNLEANLNRTKEALGTKESNAEGDTKKLKEEIDQYIHEIDKCIEWLQSM